jgi:hypothetical protein
MTRSATASGPVKMPLPSGLRNARNATVPMLLIEGRRPKSRNGPDSRRPPAATAVTGPPLPVKMPEREKGRTPSAE